MAIELIRKQVSVSNGGELSNSQELTYRIGDGKSFSIDGSYSNSSVDNHILKISRQGYAVQAAIGYSDSPIAMYFGTTTNHPLHFRTNNAQVGSINSAGEWIIGTPNTQTAVHQMWADNISVNSDTPQAFFYMTKTNGSGGAYDAGNVTAAGDNGISFFQNTTGSNYAFLALQARPTGGGTSASAGVAVDVTAAGQSNLVFFTRNGGNNAEVGRVSNGAGWTLGDPVGGGVHNVYGGFMRMNRLDTSTNSGFQVVKALNSTATTNNFIDFGINGTATNSGRIAANGANAAAFQTTSDGRLKENVVDLTGSLAKIASLRPVSFSWIDRPGDGTAIGFIAQEVEQVIPSAVTPPIEGAEDYSQWYSMCREEFIPFLVGAIKELKEEFDAYVAAHP